MHITRLPPTRGARPFAATRLALLVIVLALPRPASAAFDLTWQTAREAGLSGVCLPPQGPEATVSAGELYGLREAAGVGATLTLRAGGNLIGLRFSRLGGELYRERSLGLSFRRDLSDDLAVWLGVRALCLGARGVDERWSVAVDARASRRLLGRIYLVTGCTNLTGARIGGSPVAQEMRAGVSLMLPELSIHARMTADGVGDVSGTFAFELPLGDWLRSRAGATTSPGTFSFGIGIGDAGEDPERVSARLWPSVDLAWQWHPQLGVSSFVSVTYRL